MIVTIRVDDALRASIQAPSRDLITRPTGRAVRTRILAQLDASPSPTAVLDFQEVGLIDFSCADEVVAKLVRLLVERHLVLLGLDDEHAEAIDHVLSGQDLAVIALPRQSGKPPARRILGRTSPDTRAAFDAVCQWGPGNAERLAVHLSWTVERTADALQTLALHRLIIAAGGTYSALPLT